jgi:hypothetical protein
MRKGKCRNPKARELARRLIMGETITREMASSDETWIAARASAKAFVGIYHAKLLESGVPFDQRRAWLKRQHARVDATFGRAMPSIPSWLAASLEESAATDAPPWNVAA